MVYIRGANLDMLWVSRPSTVSTMKNNVVKGLNFCDELDILPKFQDLEPWPIADNVEFPVALQLLKASTIHESIPNQCHNF